MTDDPSLIPNDPGTDRELAAVDARLRRGMTIDPPADLAARVFHASRPALASAMDSAADASAASDVPVGRIDPFVRYGRLVAAAAMLLFGAGLMLHVLRTPATDPMGSPDELEALAVAAAPPVYIRLDAEIRQLEQRIRSMHLTPVEAEAMLLPNERSLAYDMARLESDLESERF